MPKYYKRINMLPKPTLKKVITVNGLLHQDHVGIRFAVVDVIATCDSKGKRIAFSNEVQGIMMQVKIEDIQDLLEEVIAW